MNTIELKESLHKLIDSTTDESMLVKIHELMNGSIVENLRKTYFEDLNIEQKKDLFDAFDESEDEGKLMDIKEFFG